MRPNKQPNGRPPILKKDVPKNTRAYKGMGARRRAYTHRYAYHHQALRGAIFFK
jgi:hypothetical protein